MKNNIKKGKVLEIFSAPVGYKKPVRPIVEKLILKKGYGIEGDKFALKDLDSTVMIIGINSYHMAQKSGINMEYGSLGENILLDFDPHTLPIGTVLDFGDAKIEITQRCTICSHLAVFGRSIPELLKDHRGLYCKIVSSGTIVKNSDLFT